MTEKGLDLFFKLKILRAEERRLLGENLAAKKHEPDQTNLEPIVEVEPIDVEPLNVELTKVEPSKAGSDVEEETTEIVTVPIQVEPEAKPKGKPVSRRSSAAAKKKKPTPAKAVEPKRWI